MNIGTIRVGLATLCFLSASAVPHLARAVSSAEVYTATAYGYGRVEARLRFAAGDGVISSFFLWKDGSEVAGNFWNELDFEKVGADCHVETNAIYGKPSVNHTKSHSLATSPCDAYHTYAYEWTPDAIAWLVDGVELRRETGATAMAFADNAMGGMQIHFNVWPGNASFGGNFSPSILPVHEYVDWVQFSKYADGTFTVDWREDFAGDALAAQWLTGTWASPKNLSTHDPRNVNLLDGFLVVSLTADGAVGATGASPGGTAGSNGASGAGGTPGAAGGPPGAAGGTPGDAGAQNSGGSSSTSGSSGTASPPGSTPTDDSGSGCAIGVRSAANSSASLGALAAAIVLFRRRSLSIAKKLARTPARR